MPAPATKAASPPPPLAPELEKHEGNGDRGVGVPDKGGLLGSGVGVVPARPLPPPPPSAEITPDTGENDDRWPLPPSYECGNDTHQQKKTNLEAQLNL